MEGNLSTELITKIDDVLKKIEFPERHSFFQIEKFIIGKEVTIQGQFWQIIRELKARKETIDSFVVQLEEAGDNLDLMDIEIQRKYEQLKEFQNSESVSNYNLLNIKELEIHIRKLQRNKNSLNKSIEEVKTKIRYALEESRYLVSAFEKLEKIQPYKSFDDRDAQIEFWNEKLLEEFNLRVLLRNPMDSEFVKTIMSLNDDAPVKRHLEAMLQQVQRSMIVNNQIALEKLEKQQRQNG